MEQSPLCYGAQSSPASRRGGAKERARRAAGRLARQGAQSPCPRERARRASLLLTTLPGRARAARPVKPMREEIDENTSDFAGSHREPASHLAVERLDG